MPCANRASSAPANSHPHWRQSIPRFLPAAHPAGPHLTASTQTSKIKTHYLFPSLVGRAYSRAVCRSSVFPLSDFRFPLLFSALRHSRFAIRNFPRRPLLIRRRGHRRARLDKGAVKARPTRKLVVIMDPMTLDRFNLPDEPAIAVKIPAPDHQLRRL